MSHSKIKLEEHQRTAVNQLRPGNVLLGGVGSGKTYTSLFYYLENYRHLPLYVITTARKRDDKDWEESARNLSFSISKVDSWNNIKKYKDISNAFFIFDEQKAAGYGAWATTFIKIARSNPWIMLSATPGDKWINYAPLYIANGYYKNITDFRNKHVEYNAFVSFPQIKKYHNTAMLEKIRRNITVVMKMTRTTERIRTTVDCEYDKDIYNTVLVKRWNPYEDRPIENASELLHLLRRVVNTDPSRIWVTNWLLSLHDQVIVFYNYDYELDILRNICEQQGLNYKEYNGHKHEYVDDSEPWVYLVHYTSGAEAWENISCHTMIFYSLNYAYWVHDQCEGRIDRMTTTHNKLDYFYITSNSPIDKSIRRAIDKKKSFNQTMWLRRSGVEFG